MLYDLIWFRFRTEFHPTKSNIICAVHFIYTLYIFVYFFYFFLFFDDFPLYCLILYIICFLLYFIFYLYREKKIFGSNPRFRENLLKYVSTFFYDVLHSYIMQLAIFYLLLLLIDFYFYYIFNLLINIFQIKFIEKKKAKNRSIKLKSFIISLCFLCRSLLLLSCLYNFLLVFLKDFKKIRLSFLFSFGD